MRNPRIHVRYSGPCSRCSQPTQTTLTTTKAEADIEIYVRCRDCGRITEITQEGTKPIHG